MGIFGGNAYSFAFTLPSVAMRCIVLHNSNFPLGNVSYMGVQMATYAAMNAIVLQN